MKYNIYFAQLKTALGRGQDLPKTGGGQSPPAVRSESHLPGLTEKIKKSLEKGV